MLLTKLKEELIIINYNGIDGLENNALSNCVFNKYKKVTNVIATINANTFKRYLVIALADYIIERISYAPIPRSLSSVLCDMARRCPMGQLHNAIKRRPAVLVAWSELLRALSPPSGSNRRIMGEFGSPPYSVHVSSSFSLSLYLSLSPRRPKITPRKALCFAHHAHTHAHMHSRFRWEAETLFNRK